jgi:hypothetical protein
MQSTEPKNHIIADLLSRKNSMNGMYSRIDNLGVMISIRNSSTLRNESLSFLKTLQSKADLADQLIEEMGAFNINDENSDEIMAEINEKVNAEIDIPLRKIDVISAGVITFIYFVIAYGIAFGIWGKALGKDFLAFSLYSSILAIIVWALHLPLLFSRRTKIQLKEFMFSVSATFIWLISMIVGIAGLIFWLIRKLFF